MSRGSVAGAGIALAAAALTSCSTATAGQSVLSSPSVSRSPSVSPSPPVSPSRSPTPSYPVAALTRLLRQYVKLAGGSKVSVTRGVSTNRAAALTLATPGDDAGQDADVPVYLLQALGKFTGGGMEPVPSGAHQIGGTQLMLVVNAGSMTVTDFGISTSHADIASIGAPFALPIVR